MTTNQTVLQGKDTATQGELYMSFELGEASVKTRPRPASQVAPKQPDGEPSRFWFRFYEAAVRDLTHPAKCTEPLSSTSAAGNGQ